MRSEPQRRCGGLGLARAIHSRARCCGIRRWDVAEAAPVPISRRAGSLRDGARARRSSGSGVRLHRPRLDGPARRLAAGWRDFSAGAAGGLMLAAAPGSTASLAVVPVLAVIGGCLRRRGRCRGRRGACRSPNPSRDPRRSSCSSAAPHLAAESRAPSHSGSADGAWPRSWESTSTSAEASKASSLGGAAGLGYSLATARSEGGLAAPRGRKRLRRRQARPLPRADWPHSVLTLAGRPLVGGHHPRIAQASGVAG